MKPMYRFPWTTSVLAALAFAPLLQAQALPNAPGPDSAREEPILLNVFRVTAKDDAGYGVSTSTSATRLATPLKDIPQAINIVTSAFLKDTGSVTLSDATRYIPGVSKRGVGAIPNQMFVRGFVVENLFRDGFRMPSRYTRTDLANVARIEVIKGPASAVSGRGEVGGAINFITKRPLRISQHEVTASYGSYNFYRVETDSTGPLNATGSVRYRMIAAYQDNDAEQPDNHSRILAFYPTLEWDITPKTQVSFEMSLLKNKGPQTNGTGLFISSRTAGHPAGVKDEITRREFSISEPWEHLSDAPFTGLMTLTHKFNNVFSLRQGVQFGSTTVARYFASPSQRVTLAPGTGDILISRGLRDQRDHFDNHFLQGDLVAQYEFLGGHHTTLVGYEYGSIKLDAITLTGNVTSINYTNPVYGALPTSVTLQSSLLQTTENIGFPIQHQANFFKGVVKLMGGIRYDKISDNIRFTGGVGANTNNPGEYIGSPRYGLTISPVKWLSIYGVHSEDKQQSTTTAKYSLLKPGDPRINETLTGARNGVLNEAGIKAELLDGKLSFTASYFHLRRLNQRLNISRVANDGTQYSENILSAESVRGYEMQVFGSITQRLDLVASYASSDTYNLLATGPAFITSIPEYEFSAFFNYRFHEAERDGFSIRAGYKKIGPMWGAVDNFFKLPEQDKADAGITYKRGRYQYSLQVNNLFDDTFIESAPVVTVVSYTPARQITGSLRVSF
jgi:iron complex outermembrane recepter protein